MKGSIVYGFQVNNTSPDILSCSGRSQPAGCYTIEFAFPNFYKNVKQNKPDLNQLTESVEADRQAANQNPEESKTATVDPHIDQPTEKSQTKGSDFPLIHLVYGGILVLLSATLLMGHFGKNSRPIPDQNHTPTLSNEPIPELAALGNFLFNVKAQCLLLGSEAITLTDKECKVLELLHKNFGELTPRETLMQEVWINEGVFTGRSLDMFVSKLRKKLSLDPELRITNVHGKGYKLEMSLPG
ncbi:winged helix-turn-helix transcriptional regulator [Dyadobacter sandarakinus]|uniref:Winged helix-turn-helix transcriptional regulator n=2 Tax=Dyadobacter sandarakinus TaxID=2747268 RepID=A0ABX7IDP3_9BACT|nr:winged helix-turn-helix transcriptional regulator [Dyadobacter sandarakinus]